MIFGHNTNIKQGALTFHVQTEDRGETHALIDTTVYYQGRVLHRRTNNYFDLLPLDEDKEQALKLRLDEQHRTVLEEIESNVLQLTVPPTPAAPGAPAKSVPVQAARAAAEQSNSPETQHASEPPAVPRALSLELTNARSWLAGKQASLQIVVREQNGEPVHGAAITLEVEGSAEPFVRTAESGLYGQAQFDFEMPRITGSDPAIVIRAQEALGRGQLRFALRAKPRVPAK